MSIKARLAQAGAPVVVGLAGVLIYQFEGEVKTTYLDPVGVLTACVGNTGPDLELGQNFSDQECTARFMADIQDAYKAVRECTPKAPEGMHPSLISFAFNVGRGNYCSSTLAKKVQVGQFIPACKELYRWVYAKGNVLPGLVHRRDIEAHHCIASLVRDQI